MRMGRRLHWIAAVFLLLICSRSLRAQSPRNVAEQYLFQAANAERRERGLPMLRWDETLFEAARRHAWEMAARGSTASVRGRG